MMANADQDRAVEPITSQQARAVLNAAIRERLGDDWETDPDGWTRVDSGDFYARLNKGRRNLDFYVDLLGEVRVEDSDINPAQEYGRLLALFFLSGSILLALIIAHVAGYF